MKKTKWFKKFGWIHYPISPAGWVISIVTIVFMAHIFLAVDRNSYSASDVLYGIFPYWVPTILLFEWIASKNSK